MNHPKDKERSLLITAIDNTGEVDFKIKMLYNHL